MNLFNKMTNDEKYRVIMALVVGMFCFIFGVALYILGNC
jgi:hypothetical protein